MSRRFPLPTVLMIVFALLILPLMVRADDEDEEKIEIKKPVAAKPATRPAGPRPQAKVSDEVKAVLDRINEAYTNLNSLELAGTISLNVEDGGAKRNHEAAFTSSFLAPNKFRHQVKDHPLLVSTGSKFFGYSATNNVYTQAEIKPEKAQLRDIPEEHAKILSYEDPSLILAISKDPSIDLREMASGISRLADQNIDGKAHITLGLTLRGDNTGPLTLAFDPQTHLLRRATLNMEDAFEKAGRSDITNATYHVDYTSIKPNAALKPDQFAWNPPSGSKDLAMVKAELLEGDEEEAGAAAALVGKAAPNFTLTDMEGDEVKLADLKGSVVVLDFWATWCGPCVAALPQLNKIYKEFEKDGLKMYAVNQREAKDKVEKFINDKDLTIPVLLDKDAGVGKKYMVTGIPQTVIIGKDGTVKKVIVGFNPDGEEALRGLIAELMKAN
jgi:peroxiredoxin/outer membrane lipoprotein-sorting protein